MKPKNTIILLCVAIGLFLFIRFYENKQATTKELEDRDKHAINFDQGDVTGITITNNEARIELQKQGNDWMEVSPVKDRADSQVVNQLLTGVNMLAIDNSFDADAKGTDTSLQDMGLETSNVRLKLTGKDVPPEILFGKDTAVEGRMYLRLDGSKKVYVVGNELKTLVQKKADDFRDRRLMDLDTTRIQTFDVKSASGEIEATKEHDGWNIDKPLKARGDSQKIADLVAQAINTRIDAFLPEDAANLSAYGLSEPRGTVSLTPEGSDQPVLLQIGQPTEKDKTKVYSKLSTRQTVTVLPDKIDGVLNIKPNDIRDRHLLKLNLDVVDRIHIAAAGNPEIVLARKQEDWTVKSLGDATANTAVVKQFVNRLQNAQVTAFVADTVSDLSKYGLDVPTCKVIFSSYASENTAETKAGENPFLTVDFGKAENDTVYARLESEPFIVSVPKKLVDSILTDPAQWQSLSIYGFKPEDVTSLQVTRDGQALALERDKGAWKEAKGAALNQIAIQSLLNTLSNLHAVRWTGSLTDGLGFDQPQVVIEFSIGGKPAGKLTVGATTPEAMTNAMADGKSGSFMVSKPDIEALHANLVETPAAPSPTPSAGAAAPSSAPATAIPSGSPAGVK